jgi:choline transport protein
MSSASYIAAILPNLLTGRTNIKYGPFHLPGIWGPLINGVACAYMIVWFVIYCFPFALPVDATNMNYACLIWGGLTIFVAVWWFVVARKEYVGPTATGGIVSEAEVIKGRRVSSSVAVKRESEKV